MRVSSIITLSLFLLFSAFFPLSKKALAASAQSSVNISAVVLPHVRVYFNGPNLITQTNGQDTFVITKTQPDDASGIIYTITPSL